MTKFKNKYRVETNRLKNWDYSNAGRYFITICINKRDEILGKIDDGQMILSKYGDIVKTEILQISTYFNDVDMDEWVIMPNHLHFIIVLDNMGNDNAVETIHVKTIHVETIHELSLTPQQQRRQMLIPKIIGKFKMKTSKQMNIIRNTQGYKNWQSDYYDHIIRDEQAYRRIKQYIINNPKNWDNDTFFK